MKRTVSFLFFLQLFSFTTLITAISPASQNLRTAIRKHDLIQMRLALQQDADIHEVIDDLNALAEAVAENFSLGIKELLQWSMAHPDTGFFDPYTTHVLLYLLGQENCRTSLDLVNELEQYQHSILNLPGYDFLLLNAIVRDDVSTIQASLDHNADIHAYVDAGLKIAAFNGKTHIVRALLQHSLAINKPYSGSVINYILKDLECLTQKINNREFQTIKLILWRYQLDLKNS